MADDKTPSVPPPAFPADERQAAAVPKAASPEVRAEAHKVGTEAVERALSAPA